MTEKKKGPGNAAREGMSVIELTRRFPNDDAARAWFEKRFWPEGPYCPRCGSYEVQADIKHKTMTHRCRACAGAPMFSLKTNTVMEGSKLGYQTWIFAVYLLTTNLKGVSSMKLHRDLGITQKSAWHLAHRIRKALDVGSPTFSGPVEADETYVGGLQKNRSNKQRKSERLAGAKGKAVVVGIKDRETGKVKAAVVADNTRGTLHNFVRRYTETGAEIYTDGAIAYEAMPERFIARVNHSAHVYTAGRIHTQGIESFWSMFKRAHKGTYHQMSAKHLNRYVTEFNGRHNIRDWDTIAQMAAVSINMQRKRLRYKTLTRKAA